MRNPILFALVLCILGCASRPETGESVCHSQGLLDGREYLFIENANSTSLANEKLVKLSETEGLAELNFLALSGGGANGVFGAGYLVNWGRSGGMPDFQYVTGVSAGAMLATQAFIGDVEALTLFSKLNESDIVSLRLLPFSLFSDSLYSTEPLKRKVIETLITPAVLEDVAAKSRRGGVLQIGVVDLDSGEFVQIDLGKLAEAYVSEECSEFQVQIYDRYVESILASVTIPLMMPPVYIDGRMLVDGGVRKQLFLDQAYQGPLRDSANQAATDQASIPKISITVLVNGALELDLGAFDKQQAAAPDLGNIAGRSVLTMIDSSMDNDVFRICAEAIEGSSVTVVSMDQLDAEKLAECRSINDGLFDGKYMSCLFKLGSRLDHDQAAQHCPTR
jgi:hypothetical protein